MFTHYEVLFYPAIATLIFLILTLISLVAIIGEIKEARNIAKVSKTPNTPKPRADYKKALIAVAAFFLFGLVLNINVNIIVDHFALSNKMSNAFNGHPENHDFIVSDNASGKIIGYNETGGFYWTQYIPKERISKKPSEIEYIFFIKRIKKQQGSYTNGAKAVQINYEARLVNLHDWSVIAKTEFYGTAPPSATGTGGEVKGKSPSKNEVIQWVRTEIDNYENRLPDEE